MAVPDGDRRKVEHSIVPSGCVMGIVVLVIAVAIAGYFGYRHIADALDLPEELESFANDDSVRASVRSQAPAPPEGTRLDAAWIALYVDGLDESNRALEGALQGIDSIHRASRAAGDSGVSTILTSPSFYRLITLIEPMTKRSLVEYLNARGRSLDEYSWAKTRVVAASGVTLEAVDSALDAMISPYFEGVPSGTKFSLGDRDAVVALFRRADSLRTSGAIDSTESALAAPHRQRILARGLGSIYGFDVE